MAARIAVAAWTNGVKVDTSREYVAIHLELMVDRDQLDGLRALLFDGKENTQHGIWLSNTNPTPFVERTSAPVIEPTTLSALSGTW